MLVDLHDEAAEVVAARKPPRALRATEEDRVSLGTRLDDEAPASFSSRKPSSPSFRVPGRSISPAFLHQPRSRRP